MKKKKIVITGGHVTPALAVIDELEKKPYQIYYFGRRYTSEAHKALPMEAVLLREKEITYIPITAGKIQRYFDQYTLFSYLKIPLGFFQALNYLIRIRPNLIISFGGYVSVPVVLAGWLLRIPILTHEQTASYGLASRFNSYFAKKIAVSWPISQKYFPKKKVVLTGNPIRKEVLQTNKKIWQVFDFDEKLPLIFITGGNQGSRVINQTVSQLVNQLVKKYNLFHHLGPVGSKGILKELEKVRQKIPLQLRNRYHSKKYLDSQEMGTFLNKADLIIARSGANTVTELAALGKPALFIPLPFAATDEQTKNAQLLVEAGTAEVLPQEKLSPKKLWQLIEKIMNSLDDYQKKSSQAKKLVKLDASKEIVRLVEKIIQ